MWRDFSISNPSNITGIYPDEDGFPNLRLALLGPSGASVATTSTNAFGQFHFSNVAPGLFRVQIEASNFQPGFSGTFWLGPQSLTPTSNLSQTAQALLSVPLIDISMILAYLWIWAGFTMVVVAAGLAALDREVLEAAHVDGATEWQTFRLVTIPMLAPVLTVVFVTMVINVLKIFDIVVNLGIDSSQPGGQASTLASDVYYLGFGGGRPYGPCERAGRHTFRARRPGDAVQPEEDQRQMTTVPVTTTPAAAQVPALQTSRKIRWSPEAPPSLAIGHKPRPGRDRTVLARTDACR